VFVCTVELTD